MAYLPQPNFKRDRRSDLRIARERDWLFGKQPGAAEKSQQESGESDDSAQHTESGKVPAGFTAHHTPAHR